MSALVLLAILLVVSGIANIWMAAAYQQQARKARRLERDERIAELERAMDMNVPALTSVAETASPLVRLLAVIVGIWVADKSNHRRRVW